MHEFWIIPTANVMYTRSQKYTNMVVGERGIQSFKVVLLLLLVSFNVFVPTRAHPLLFLNKWFVQMAQAQSSTQLHYLAHV